MSDNTFTFGFILQGRFSAEQQMDLTDSLIEAGCDYPEVSAHNDIISLEFFSQEPVDDCEKVILEEISRVESTGVFISAMTLNDAVTVSDIAERSGINKMNISRYSRHLVGGEDFPDPAYGEKWSWAEVAAWLHGRNKIPMELWHVAKALKTIGNAVKVRTLLREANVAGYLQQISRGASV